jgi:Ca-activated chloride channel homolog
MSKSIDIHDDPRTTALLLGELDAAESAALEAALAADPEAQAFFEDLQATTELLSSALAAEPMPELRTPQREQILSGTPVVSPAPRTMWRFVLPLAAAFTVVGIASWVYTGGKQTAVTSEVAMAPQVTPEAPAVSAEANLTALDDQATVGYTVSSVPDEQARFAESSTPVPSPAPPPVQTVVLDGNLAVYSDNVDDAEGLSTTLTTSAPAVGTQAPATGDAQGLLTLTGVPPSSGPPLEPTVSISAASASAPDSVTQLSTLADSTYIFDATVPVVSTIGAEGGVFQYRVHDGPLPIDGTNFVSNFEANGTLAVEGVNDVTWTTEAFVSPVNFLNSTSISSVGWDASANSTMALTAKSRPTTGTKPIMVGRGEYAVELRPTPGRSDTSVTAHAAISPPDPAVTPAPVADLEQQKRAAEASAARAAQELERQRRQLAEAQARLAAAELAAAKKAAQATPGTERYAPIIDNPFKSVDEQDTSTFSVDVDTAAYANMRRFLRQGQLPPPASVRIEELINYFNYDYPQPADDHPFAAAVEIAQCPWNLDNRLLRVGLNGKIIDANDRPSSNLVFLVDVSGSMSASNKLPLLQKALKVLVSQLDERDSVGIVTYAGASGVALPSTTANNQETINHAIDKMRSGGSTNGASGIMRAYQMAQETFIKGGLNRVILATDGDFNVGITNRNDLTTLIEGKAKSGVFLSVLGFGMGNLNDHTLGQLADKGNGNYAYIDDYAEARKVLLDEMMGTLLTIAKDVKVQMVFNDDHVQDYRLIGYENRRLAKKDFDDDTKDAGEIGAGHTVTALYELNMRPRSKTAKDAELVQLRLRYKQPDGQTSQLMEAPVYDNGGSYADASDDFKFAASVAAFGMLLRGSPYAGNASFDGIAELAEEGRGPDLRGYRQEFLNLVNATRTLTRKVPLPPRQTVKR